jgi:hypothetical protein
MPTPNESREALQLLTGAAIATSQELLSRLNGSPEQLRAALLDGVPELVGYYADGSAALAADFYEESRELAGVDGRFTAQMVVADRVVAIRRAVAWASEPLFEEDGGLVAASRLAEGIQIETARGYRDTILENRRRDPASVGWRRITRGGCKFCRMLADRGAIYREATVRFAAHGSCHCSAEPVFTTNDTGEEASVMQYLASRRSRTSAQKQALREYLEANYS